MAEPAKKLKRKRYLVTMTLPHTCWAENESMAKTDAKVHLLKETQDKLDPAKKLNIQVEELDTNENEKND